MVSGPLCYSEHLILSLLCIHGSLPVPVNEFKTLHIRLIGNYTAVSVFTSFVNWAGIFQFICCNIYKLFNPCTDAPNVFLLSAAVTNFTENLSDIIFVLKIIIKDPFIFKWDTFLGTLRNQHGWNQHTITQRCTY